MNLILQQIEKIQCYNQLCAWVAVASVAFVISFCLRMIVVFIAKRLQKIVNKTSFAWNSVLLDLFDSTKIFVIFFWLFYLFSKSLTQKEFESKILLTFLVIFSSYQISLWGLLLIKRWYSTMLAQKTHQDPASSGALGLLYRMMQTVFLSIVILIALSNLNVNVGALLAGFGVGGIAVALAAQNILGDLLASLSIVLDKPFCVGDLIYTGQEKGTVEQIGIKTTRLRSLSGEQLVIPNRNILDSRIQNFKRMTQRRVVQKFSVVYATPPDKLENIPKWIKSITDEMEKLRFDRCHLANYGASGLEYEFVFYVLDPDSTIYMELQQQVLLKILNKFALENIKIAFQKHVVVYSKE